MSGRRLGNRRIKGVWMPSFQNANRPSEHKSYAFKPHQGVKQVLRNLRIKTRPIIDSKDPAVQEVGQRVIRAVLDEPNVEFSALHLISAGLDYAEQTQQPWADVMGSILDKFEETARNQPQPEVVFLRRKRPSLFQRWFGGDPEEAEEATTAD